MTTRTDETTPQTARQPDTQPDMRRVAGVLKALADPTRLRIFTLLRAGEACVCEIAGELGLAENLVSHHLGVLRRSGLVRDRRDVSDARWVYYQLDPATLDQCAPLVGALFDSRALGVRIPRCGPAASIRIQVSPRGTRGGPAE
ncbi:MAG: ArsR/SmtB family transcription factor [Ktedonobacterales bacterium]